MQMQFDWNVSLSYPPIESFERLIRYAACKCSQDPNTQDDLAQDLRIKYIECLKIAENSSMTCISFTKYFKTAVWNYVSGYFARKKRENVFYDLELVDSEMQSSDASLDELVDVEIESDFEIEIWRLYSDGTMIEWLREAKEEIEESQGEKKKKWSKGKVIDVLAKKLGKSRQEILGLLKSRLKDRRDRKTTRKRNRMEESQDLKDAARKYRKVRAASFRKYRKAYQDRYPKRVKKSRQKYEKSNREKLLAYHRKYYQENLQAMREYHRKYYEENADAMREYHREYYKSHNRLAYFQAYRAKNRARIEEYFRKYYEAHGERVRKARVDRYRSLSQEEKKT